MSTKQLFVELHLGWVFITDAHDLIYKFINKMTNMYGTLQDMESYMKMYKTDMYRIHRNNHSFNA